MEKGGLIFKTLKGSKMQGRHMIIEVKCGQIIMNEYSCNDLLKKVKDKCSKYRSNNNGLITYRDCKQLLSDAEYTPKIDARFECILVRLFPVCCIILRDSVLVVANGNTCIDDFIKNLCYISDLYHRKVDYIYDNGHRSNNDMQLSLSSFSNSLDEHEQTSDTSLSFEVSVLECCYSTAISHLEIDLIDIEGKFRHVEQMASSNKKYKNISILIHELKQPVSNLTEIMRGFEDLMDDILNSQQYMNLLEFSNHAKIYSNNPYSIDSGEYSINRDLECLLEYFDQEIESLSKRSRSIGSSLNDLETYINLELSISLNEIMRFELMCSIIGATFGAGGCIAGLFGMNVINGYEDSKSMFALVSVSCLLLLLVSLFIIRFLHKYSIEAYYKFNHLIRKYHAIASDK